MTHELMQSFNINALNLGNLAATFLYSYVIMQLFVGILLDRYNVRLFIALAILLCAIACIIFAHSKHLWIAQISRASMGIGVAFATVGYMKIISIWFRPNQFAFLAGLLGSSAMLGALFGQAPLAWLIQTIGWQKSLQGIGIVGLILGASFYLIVRTKNIHNPKQSPIRATFSWKEVSKVIRNKQNWLLTVYCGLLLQPLVVFCGLWGPTYVREVNHLSITSAASIVSFGFLGCAVGSPLIGLLSDRLRKRRIMLAVGNIAALFLLIFIIYFNLAPLLLGSLIFLFGIATGVCMLVFAIGRENNNLLLAATVAALINTGDAVIGSLSEPLVGKILDWQWKGAWVNGIYYFSSAEYRIALSILPIYLIVALLLLYFIKEKA